MYNTKLLIKQLRKRSYKTLTDFADLLSVPVSLVQDWEDGTTDCPQYIRDLIYYYLVNERVLISHNSRPTVAEPSHIITVYTNKDIHMSSGIVDTDICIPADTELNVCNIMTDRINNNWGSTNTALLCESIEYDVCDWVSLDDIDSR